MPLPWPGAFSPISAPRWPVSAPTGRCRSRRVFEGRKTVKLLVSLQRHHARHRHRSAGRAGLDIVIRDQRHAVEHQRRQRVAPRPQGQRMIGERPEIRVQNQGLEVQHGLAPTTKKPDSRLAFEWHDTGSRLCRLDCPASLLVGRCAIRSDEPTIPRRVSARSRGEGSMSGDRHSTKPLRRNHCTATDATIRM